MIKKARGLQLDGRSGNISSTYDKYKFTGKERDTETGYHYHGARYYDSKIARWTSVDPIRQYNSPYVYVGNNPVRLVDPTGTFGGLSTKYTVGGVEVDQEMFNQVAETRPNQSKKNKQQSQEGEQNNNGNENLYEQAKGLWKGHAIVRLKLGMVVEIVVENVDPYVGITIDIKSDLTNEKQNAVLSGYLIPRGEASHIFRFTAFGNEPMKWNFIVTSESDACTVKFVIRSSWIQGMEPNPPAAPKALVPLYKLWQQKHTLKILPRPSDSVEKINK